MTFDERAVLISGLVEWTCATPTEAILQAIGFSDSNQFPDEQLRLAYALRYAQRLSAADWQCVLTATEIGLATNYLGFGPDWQTRTGRDDHDTLNTLRALQQKLSPVIGRAPKSPGEG